VSCDGLDGPWTAAVGAWWGGPTFQFDGNGASRSGIFTFQNGSESWDVDIHITPDAQVTASGVFNYQFTGNSGTVSAAEPWDYTGPLVHPDTGDCPLEGSP
jgi:hypothetical protein